LGGEGGKFDRGRGGGKINHGLGLRKGFQRIIGNQDPQGSAAHTFADIAANPCVTCAFHTTNQPRAGMGGDALDQHLPHAARGSGDDNSGGGGHDAYSSFGRL
jgi:hypothetical protein